MGVPGKSGYRIPPSTRFKADLIFKNFYFDHTALISHKCPKYAIEIKKKSIRLLGELKCLFYFSHTSAITYGFRIIILMTYAIADVRSK